MSEGCVLHVAALPFPSHQGTQAAIRAMLEASTRTGRRAELFTYAAEGYALSTPFPVHRTGDLPRVRSLRSGPSLAKLLLDARMGFELRALLRRLRPSVIVAHHVEAAALAVLQRTPTVFFAHTDLQAELPSYARPRYGALLSWAGAQLDRQLLRHADAVATISLQLRDSFSSECTAIYVPTPWPLPRAISDEERAASRRQLHLAADGCIALYAGNLDAYQDADSILDALHTLACAGLQITLLLATLSEPTRFLRRAAELGVPCRSHALGDETVRRRVHAAADLVIVPRGAAGGLPIKLLDAMSRGVPCAIASHAAAGLPIADCVLRAGDRHASLAEAIALLARDPALRRCLATRGREYIAREHNDRAFCVALDRAVSAARNRLSSS